MRTALSTIFKRSGAVIIQYSGVYCHRTGYDSYGNYDTLVHESHRFFPLAALFSAPVSHQPVRKYFTLLEDIIKKEVNPPHKE